MSNDRRIIADRQADAADAIDRLGVDRGGTPMRAVQVYDGGHIPASVPAWYLTHPVEFDGSEVAGSVGTPVADASASIPVLVIVRPADPGDVLVADLVGSKWVANGGRIRDKSGCGDSFLICLRCGPGNGNAPITNATITITGTSGFRSIGNTGTGSCAAFHVPKGGTYTITVRAPNYPPYAATLAINGCSTLLTIAPPGTSCCGGVFATTDTPYAIPLSMTLTGSAGTTPFAFSPDLGAWYGCLTFDADNIITSVNYILNGRFGCATIGRGKVRIAYVGQCTDAAHNLDHSVPTGQFRVTAYWSIAGYTPTGICGGPTLCPPYDPNNGTFGCDPGGICTYLAGDCTSGFLGNAAASRMALPDSFYPFAWAGTLQTPSNSWPQGNGTIPCPVPGLDVAISA